MPANAFASPSAHCRKGGFSLVELLVVCSIIALVVGFTIPAATTLIRGSQLTQAAQLITDQINLARQLALSKNRAVEVRFYRFADEESPGERVEDPTSGRYRAFQCFEITESGAAVPLNRIQRLPATVVFDKGALSTLLNPELRGIAKKPTQIDPELPRNVKRNYEYQSFRFLQNGSTDLPAARPNSTTEDNWFITLHSIDLPEAMTDAKDPRGGTINFFTLQIDPLSGSTKSYRPNAG